MTWGVRAMSSNNSPAPYYRQEKMSFSRETFTFNFIPDRPCASVVDKFRKYYGPTMNAFEAADKNGRAVELQRELEALFTSQNQSPNKDATSIPATFLQVTATRASPRARCASCTTASTICGG